jgi:tRNA U34 2-thiouridine synthase MnmA/TrmU
VWAWGGRAEEVAMLLSGGVDSSVSVWDLMLLVHQALRY